VLTVTFHSAGLKFSKDIDLLPLAVVLLNPILHLVENTRVEERRCHRLLLLDPGTVVCKIAFVQNAMQVSFHSALGAAALLRHVWAKFSHLHLALLTISDLETS
jgi:hypothetical protein